MVERQIELIDDINDTKTQVSSFQNITGRLVINRLIQKLNNSNNISKPLSYFEQLERFLRRLLSFSKH